MNRIRELRNKRGMTQSQLGEYLKVGHTTVSMYENGQRQPDPDTISAMCDAFECTSDYLLGRSDVSEPSVSTEDAALLKAYHAATPKDRRIVDQILVEYLSGGQ